MLSLSQRRPFRPVRIDISWLKPRASSASDSQAEHEPSGQELVERARLVARILELNPTASSEFLAAFQVNELDAYLSHLVSATQPRGRLARWIRPDNTPGIARSEARI